MLVVGLGGLGSAAALYLAGAGVGRISLLDGDRVALSDLHRQVLYTSDDVGKPKASAARDRLAALNSEIDAVPLDGRLEKDNARRLLEPYDFICDCTDRFEARLRINEACHRLKRPFSHGGIEGGQGQVTTFHTAAGTPCYRCLYPAGSVPRVPDRGGPAGVIGPATGVVGCLQAMEGIKQILGEGDPRLGRLLFGRLLIVDLWTSQVTEIKYDKNASCPVCRQAEA